MELPGAVVSDARTSSYEINSSFVLSQFNSCYFVFPKWIVLALNIYLGHLRLRKLLFQFNVTVWHLPLPIHFVFISEIRVLEGFEVTTQSLVSDQHGIPELGGQTILRNAPSHRYKDN